MNTVIPLSLVYATSLDSAHPPSNAIDPDEASFWITTGLFPQEIAFNFPDATQIIKITTVTGKVRGISIFAAGDAELTNWIEIDTFNLPAQPIKQQETHQLSLKSATYGLKVVINQAWGPFAAIYLIKVEGSVLKLAN
jgi:heat shock protein beta-11